MKKPLLMLLGIVFVIMLYGCAQQSDMGFEVVDTFSQTGEVDEVWLWRQFYDVTGMIIYHNPELDRGDGKEVMQNPLYNVILRVDTHSYFAKQFFFTSWAYMTPVSWAEFVDILLWCTSDMLTLSGEVMIVEKDMELWREWYFTLWSLLGISQKLPQNLSGKVVQAKLTRPIFTYPLDVDLPDVWRIEQCSGYSQIKDIIII